MADPDMHTNTGVHTCTLTQQTHAQCACRHMQSFALASASPRTHGFETLSEVVSSPSAASSHDPAHWPLQELMELIHLHLVKEYIIRLSKRRLVLKSAEQQQQLARHILANANLIQSFCTQNVSPSSPCALRLSKLHRFRLAPFWARGAFLETGQPPSNQVCLAGLPGDLAASSPPHAR